MAYRRSGFFLSFCLLLCVIPVQAQDAWQTARVHAGQANEAFLRSELNTAAWLRYVDPISKLLPDNFRSPIYTPENYAADNYPFMICTSYITRPERLTGIFRTQLQQEMQLTTLPGGLPTWFNLETQMTVPAKRSGIFSGSEYVKDGLVAICELIGDSPWYDRSVQLIDAVMKHAATPSKRGMLPDPGCEVNGEMLQVLTRFYWKTRDAKYLVMAVRIGDAYCYDQLPNSGYVPIYEWDFMTNTGERIARLNDHGTEIIGGLTLLYATLKIVAPEKAETYYEPLSKMLKTVAEVGFNEDGMMKHTFNLDTGEILRPGYTDNWGYNYMAWLNFAMATGDRQWEQPVRHALKNLHKYRNYRWEHRGETGQSHDGYADSIEGAMNLLNRVDVPAAWDWVDSEMQVMYGFQQEDGRIESWHGDGNFSRTALMYGLYKTQGVRLSNWHPGLQFGAVRDGDKLYLHLESDSDWHGTVQFDYARHNKMWSLPHNWPRLNEFPEWYTLEPMIWYRIHENDGVESVRQLGAHMVEGIPMSLRAGVPVRWMVEAAAK